MTAYTAITQRPYRGLPDHASMIGLARRFAGDHLHVADLPYRLSSWALDDPANAALWLDGSGRLVAWAALQTPFWALDFALDPGAGAEGLPTVLAWAGSRARQVACTPYGREAWFAKVFERHLDHRAHLEAAGFADQSGVAENPWSAVWLARPAAGPLPAAPPPPGIALRPLAGREEVAAVVQLHRLAFETKNMTLEWRDRVVGHPGYVPELDLVAVEPQGDLVGYCLGWLAPAGPGGPAWGQIEPLCVRPTAWAGGLGRSLLVEVMRRLHARGAAVVRVETDDYRGPALNLYLSAGFRLQERVLVYRKDV